MKINRTILFSFTLLSCLDISAQKVYELTAPKTPKKVVEGELNMGGKAPDGGTIAVNSYYMSINGKPVIPVMGEFHYSRYPQEQWEEEILKMKAGGINVLPTYLFWSLHEKEEGKFDWSGNLNVRHFFELCKKHDMNVIARIGPFGHGEIRNGALPDWLFAKPLEVRSNDELYLFYVKRLYNEIGKQLAGLYYKDGGPIIGTQIENEHQHSAAPWGVNYPGEPLDMTTATYDKSITMIGVSVQGKKITTSELGDLHMKTLKNLAEEAGIITPIYTATGWGNAAVIGNEAIPVTAAYTYPFWAEPEMSQFCMFKNIQKNPDYAPVRYSTEKFPSFCAEMGAGIQMIYKRRPIVAAKAAEALMVRTLGSGANGIGYYMYHGGSTPLRADGIGSYQDEPMGMPKISYDFQAPLGEFGQEHESYRTLRLLHSFLTDFADKLAPMETVLPDGFEKMTPGNRDDLRYAARMKDGSGFVFMVNFQDHDAGRHDQKGLQLRLNMGNEVIQIPANGTFTLPKDESIILPFNLNMDDAILKYATAQLLMKINDNGKDHYFFFAPEGMSVEYTFDSKTVRGKHFFAPVAGLKSTFSVRTKSGKEVRVTTLTREQALNSCKVDGKLLITDASVIPGKGEAKLLSLGKNKFDYILYPSKQGFKTQSSDVPQVTPAFTYKNVGARHLTVHFNEQKPSANVQEYFLRLNYTADVAMGFINGRMVLDEFYHGAPWTIGLKRFANQLKDEDLTFYFRPLRSDASFLIDLPKESIPDFSKGDVCRVNSVEIIPEYVTNIKL